MMDFFEAVSRRRSIRKYTPTLVPDSVIEKALEAALIAPNSSNLQTWNFYWVQSEDKRKALIEACLNQNAARTAQHLMVIVADYSLWKKHCAYLIDQFKSAHAPEIVFNYYQKLIPFIYGWRVLSPLKWLGVNAVGFFKPMSRSPLTVRDLQEVSIKSAALAAENFMLAVAAQGYDTCPMEGFDEARVKKILSLKCKSRVVMVISVGERDPKGVWGEQIRVPSSWVVKKI